MSKAAKKKVDRYSLLMKIFLLLVIVLALARVLLCGHDTTNTIVPEQTADLARRENFAKCLMEKGWIMYGVNTCQYCQLQKKMFGQAFEQVKYIDCDFDQAVCVEKNITHYPVWEHGETQLLGIQTPAQLARDSGCEI